MAHIEVLVAALKELSAISILIDEFSLYELKDASARP
jgi:hypothetical protein